MLTLARSVQGQEPETPAGSPRAPASDARAIPPPTLTATPRSRIQISDVRLKRSAELALRFASEQVAANGCRGLLSEFVDERGQTLEARLERLQLSLRDYLHAVYFLDGSALPSCTGPVAVTTPGSRVVYLCSRLTRESTSETWVTIIHEVLHSLGLGEHPPSPAHISNRVRKHCG
jgi:hypothetical protein